MASELQRNSSILVAVSGRDFYMKDVHVLEMFPSAVMFRLEVVTETYEYISFL